MKMVSVNSSLSKYFHENEAKAESSDITFLRKTHDKINLMKQRKKIQDIYNYIFFYRFSFLWNFFLRKLLRNWERVCAQIGNK